VAAPSAVVETGTTSLAELEKRHILSLMEKTSNRTQAARLLGISIRTLRNKLRDYGVNSKDDDLVEEGAESERKPAPMKQLGLI
jgi:DNA-binding NtrC family response regulator